MKQFAIIEGELCMGTEAVISAIKSDVEVTKKRVFQGIFLNKKGQTNSWRNYPNETDRRRKWIVYDSIPKRTKEQIDFYYKDVWQCYYAQGFVEAARAKMLVDDTAFFLNHKKNGIGFRVEQAAQLSEGCGWLRMLEARELFELFGKKGAYYEQAARVLASRSLYHFKISNGRTLERRVKKWAKEGIQSMVSRKFGNKNGQKLSEMAVKRIVTMYASPLKPTYKKVAEVFNEIDRLREGWEEITTERVRQICHLPQYKSQIVFSRHGEDAHKNEYERTIKRRRPSFPDALWSVDGMTVQLYYVDETGAMRSDLYCVAVLDVHSDYCVGYAMGVGRGEPATLVQKALRSTCRSKHGGWMPYQIQYDNSSANKARETQQLFAALAKLHFPCAPYNGKAKPVENWIGRIEGHYLRYLPNFKGGNITSHSIERKANPDFLAKQKKTGELPNQREAIAAFIEAIQVYNHTPNSKGETPLSRYCKPHAKRRKMSYEIQVSAFWVKRTRTIRYTKDGLIMEVNKERFTYEVEQERGVECTDFRGKYLGDSFTVYYDPDDLEFINIYQEGVWIATAHQKWEAPMAVVDMEEGERELINKSLSNRTAEKDKARTELAIVRMDVEEAGFEAFNHRLAHKAAYNRLQEDELDDIIERTGRIETVDVQEKLRPKKYSLVDTGKASLKEIDF